MSVSPKPADALRALTPADAEWMQLLHAASFDAARAWTLPVMQETLHMPTLLALGHCSDQPHGFILCSHVLDEAEILTLAVHPSFRRQGIASRLMQAAMDKLAGQKIKKVFLEVAIDNLSAIALYRHFGFTQTGLRQNYYRYPSHSVDALVMTHEFSLP